MDHSGHGHAHGPTSMVMDQPDPVTSVPKAHVAMADDPNVHHGMAMAMDMAFHFRTTGAILFEGWNPKTISEFVGACFAWFFIAVLYEFLKALRELVHDRTRKVHCCPERHGTGLDSPPLPTSRDWFFALINPGHIIDTLMYGIQFVVAYCLMLVVMTYNVYLFIAIICGAVVGHFLFGWRKRASRDGGHCF